MTARASCTAIIARVRAMAGLPPTSVISDDELQDMLDERRMDVIEAQLRFRPSIPTPPSIVQYLDFWAPVGNWEDSVELKDATNAVILQVAGTPPDPVADLVRGRWSWAAPGKLPPIFITGSYHDVYGAAVSVLQRWAGQLAREFDFGTDAQTFSRSQQTTGLLKLADEYKRKAIPPGKRPGWRALEW